MINNACKVHGHNITFSSLNNPVKPFQVMTRDGLISFKEVDYNKKLNPKIMKKLGEFFLDKFANTSSHPFWQFCKKNSLYYDADIYKNFRDKELINPIKLRFGDPDTTLMIGFDENKNIAGAIFSNKLKIKPKGCEKKEYLYIDLLAVDEKYRGLNIGKQLLNNVISASKTRFKEVFLVAYKESVNFYKKQGFCHIDLNKTYDKALESLFAKDRIDYPYYVNFIKKEI